METRVRCLVAVTLLDVVACATRPLLQILLECWDITGTCVRACARPRACVVHGMWVSVRMCLCLRACVLVLAAHQVTALRH